MAAFKVPEGEVEEIMKQLDIRPEGYAVQLHNEDTIVLLHYKTHLELTVHKGVKKEWL